MRLDGTRPDRFEMIANQMMKSMSGKGYKGSRKGACNTSGDREEIEEFKRVYFDTITYLETMFPRTGSMPLSVGVVGAIGKAILWYGKTRMKPFVESMSKREFKGRNDPCFVLWEWIVRNSNRNANEAYNRTVSAIRYFLNDKECKELRAVTEDIFEWDGNFRHMCQYKRRNQNTNSEGTKSATKQSDEAIAADIQDCLSGCPT